jgi:hypothetical protein
MNHESKLAGLVSAFAAGSAGDQPPERADAVGGHPSRVDTVTPQVYDINITFQNGGLLWFAFNDQDTAFLVPMHSFL